ncbi:hypothetical protein CEXT_785191 [Caerostris extrusa]|uniref:Uncharacterized protein n=1 Tax=Caerostris extrusa TaxID=172846 RepID=A0AAV4YCG7_CAEEX|nr:hypothetical protein CEXT_785191 [Caerostris extrusa]
MERKNPNLNYSSTPLLMRFFSFFNYALQVHRPQLLAIPSAKKTNLILIIAGFNLEPNHSPFGEARKESQILLQDNNRFPGKRKQRGVCAGPPISSYWRFSSKKTNLILIIAGFNLEPNHSPFGEARKRKPNLTSRPIIGFRDKKKSEGVCAAGIHYESIGHTKAISSYWRFSSKETNLILIIAGFNLEPNHSPFGEARKESQPLLQANNRLPG